MNIFALPYKIRANKIKRPLVISGIQVDSRLCTTLSESIRHIVEVLFPAEEEVLHESQEDIARRTFVESFENTNHDRHFDKIEVRTALRTTKRRKASGLDGLPYEIIGSINGKCPGLLVTLFNKCLDLGNFPRPWKKAKLVLLNKPGKDTVDPRSYRPICLLSTMSKVLDKLIAQRILHHYLSRSLLNPLQHGFRAGKSCESAGFELKSKVIDKIKGNHGVCIVSFDVAGAFDNVSWKSILYNLGRAYCPINVYRLVKSYLE